MTPEMFLAQVNPVDRLLSVVKRSFACLSVSFSQFHFHHKKPFVNFNLTLQKTAIDEGDLRVLFFFLNKESCLY